MPDDLLFQNISTVQNNLQPKPKTVASTTTIAPSTFLTFVTGTVAITTITPPVTGTHMLCFVFTSTATGVFLTTGNVTVATTTVVANVPVLMVYDPITAKYYQLLGK